MTGMTEEHLQEYLHPWYERHPELLKPVYEMLCEQHDEMVGSSEYWRQFLRRTIDEFDRLRAENERLTAREWQLTEAIRLTQEYIGDELLPPTRGWSWYDALNPELPPMPERLVCEFCCYVPSHGDDCCSRCSGAACGQCGFGPIEPPCEHDVIDRHEGTPA